MGWGRRGRGEGGVWGGVEWFEGVGEGMWLRWKRGLG